MSFGWELPKENWSKLPHQFIDHAMPEINSLAELKVILYILRHTWGRGDKDKLITLDEFEKGRKNKHGERIDGGVGMSRNGIKTGLSLASEHGYITIVEDNRDLARKKRFYSLSNSESQNLTLNSQDLTLSVPNVDPRTEKETKKDTLEKELSPTGDGTTVPEIIKAWLDASGSLDKGAYKKTGFRSVAKNIIDAGFTAQDVTDYINDVKRPNFTPSLGVIQNGIVEWATKRKLHSGQSSNGMTEAQRLEVIFDDSKWGKPDLEGVDTRPYLIRMGLVEEFDSE